MNTQLDRIEVELKLLTAKLNRVIALLEPKKSKRLGPIQTYSPEFEAIWAIYPKRAGSNPKQAAYKAFRARQREGVGTDSLKAGVTRYAAFCAATGKQGTEYCMTASRFFGPGREWEADWTPPAVAPTLPKTEEEWLAYGRSKGVEPRTGEPWDQYKRRIQRGAHHGPADPERTDFTHAEGRTDHADGCVDVRQLL